MAASEIEVTKAPSVIEPAQAQPKKNTTPHFVADKRAEAVRTKKKKKRAAHRVALRKSHTGR
jgi:hypothetical protein